MRRIAIVGAGQSGALLARALLRRHYDVTLVTDRTADQVRSGPVMSSQCMFDSALTIERELDADQWAKTCPRIERVAVSVGSQVSFAADLEHYAQSVDQRVKCAAWIDEFAAAGGKLVIRAASIADLEELAYSHDLVIVSTGKGDLGRLFAPDREKSPFDRPQRALALAYVRGLGPHPDGADLSLNIAPGVGEYFVLPALTTSGPCHVMVFEGIPHGPMDRWDDVRSPEQHLQRAKEILAEHFPREFARCADIELTDDKGILRGRFTPTVRHPVATLPSGAPVLGMADAVVLNDPVTGQGSNNAVQAAGVYFDAIVGRDSQLFDPRWMQQTFDKFWRGWGQWSVSWTNTLLRPIQPHVLSVFEHAQQIPGVAAAIVEAFNDPRTTHNWWYDATEATRFLAAKEQAASSRFDNRDLRRALGQYATGVTVVTSRAPDGRKIGVTANSFTSVSMDPPLVLWCPAKKAPSLPDLISATHFAVNILAADQHDLSRQFSTPAEDKFAGVATSEGCGGVPLIDNAVARFQCRTVQRVDAGDHVIFLGEVESYDAPGGEPLVFHSGAYRLASRHPEFP
ncbi:flavin reductase family protein [Skermania sp. ID1734]|uniref:flavin reductase n=1 Tax=Skermania sp. ID1734 TaxID=2597516 RepID=UPI001180B161|nr:flavin reductase [Skermania sp. ID1734]TSD94224.1 flavin reductase family protein [Skermania sp. ID1734]